MSARDRFFREFPKLDRHVHLLGAVRGETFLELARRPERGVGAEEVLAFYRPDGPPLGAIRVLRAIEQRIPLVPADLHRITYEHLADAVGEGLCHSELF